LIHIKQITDDTYAIQIKLIKLNKITEINKLLINKTNELS